MENEEIIEKFLEISPYDIATSEALKRYVEKYEYVAINDEDVFPLLMKLLHKHYW